MSRPSFWLRLLQGRLIRWEQALVGGVTGLICALVFTGALVMTSTETRGPDALSIPEAALIFGAIGALYGTILGAFATVSPNAGDHLQTNTTLPDARGQDWIVAFVWAPERSTPESLRALGRELEAWRADKTSVTSIQGLDRLLSGQYPLPEGPTTYYEDPEGEPMLLPRRNADSLAMEFELRRMSVIDRWFYSPALVWADEGMTSDEAIESLRQSITPDLVSWIGYTFLT